jgi:Secretion system C-terminal sorting domain
LTGAGSIQTTSSFTNNQTFKVNIGGTTLGTNYDQLSSAGAITLAGTLNVALVNGYTPTNGTSFTIIDGTSLSGTFSTTNLPTLSNGLSWSVNYNGSAGTVILSVSSVLPVEILDFTGKNTEGGNLLTWQTASEVNNKGFQIERLNTSGNWDNIGFKTANNKASTYQFVDNQPFETSYYRLRQFDNDGTETVSKVISIATKGNGKGLKVYPNPVSNVLTVDYTEGSLFQVINLLGQQVLTGKTGQRLDVSALPQGSYILKVGAEQAKFIKQ